MSHPIENGAGLVSFVPGRTRQPEPKAYNGLDLGRRKDHSALAGLDLLWFPRGHCPVTYAHLYQPRLDIRSLTRFPYGTDYDDLHTLVSKHLELRSQKQELVIDAGGPGLPMVDRLRNTLTANVAIRPVFITGGKVENTLSGGYVSIPRRSLITTLLLVIDAHSLTCKEGLEHWDIFEDELIELRGDTSHPASSSGHDDLVMALALAVSAAVRDTPQLLPPSDERKADGRRFGFIDKPLF